LLLLFIFIHVSFYAQKNTFQEKENLTYIVENTNSIENVNSYLKALNQSNFNNHRLRSKRNTISFENGLQGILFSAEELHTNGFSDVNTTDFPLQFINYYPSTFHLAPNNYIIEAKKTIHPKHK
jgi:hypothetical protein